jgi:hypothetical protein
MSLFTFPSPEVSSADTQAHDIRVVEYPPLPTPEPSPEPSPDLTQGEFPLDALNATQREIVERVADTYRLHPSLPGISSLAVIGGALGRGFAAVNAMPGCETYPNIFALNVALRSTGKGNSASKIAAPIIHANSALQTFYRDTELPALKVRAKTLRRELEEGYKSGTTEEQRLAEIERDLGELELQIKHPPALYTGSATGAATSELLARNDEQLLFYSPEAGDALKVALGRFTADNSADIDLLLSGYSVESFSESRVSRGNKHFEHPCISILWYVQPLLLADLIGDEKAVDRGFTARFLYAAPPATDIPYDDGRHVEVPAVSIERWGELVGRLLEFRGQPTHQIGCYPEAQEIFRAYHNEVVGLRNGIYRDVQGDLGRARENAIRVALGQCVADAVDAGRTPREITPDQARRAVRIVRFSYGQFISVMAPVRDAQWTKRLLRLIEICRQSGGHRTLNDLDRSNGFSRETVVELVRRYPESLKIETTTPGSSGGRPSEIVRLIGLGGSVGFVGRGLGSKLHLAEK